MSTATTTTSHDAGQRTTSRSTTQPTTNPATQTSPNAAQRLRTTMAAVRLAFTWLGVRKTLAPEQRTTAARAFHADRELLAVARGGWCKRIKTAPENTEGSRPVMATCSPRVGITLAESRQARLRRRYAPHPAQAIPASPITHVDGSGTATGLARRTPTPPMPSFDGAPVNLPEDDKSNALPNQPPPRNPRDEPAVPSRSFHSQTLPLWSNVP